MATFPDTALPAGYILHWFDSVGSTMDEARTIMASNPTSPQVIWAGEQRTGRGRRGHLWVSPKGNMYATVALPVEGNVSQVAQFSFVVALSLATAICRLVPDVEHDLALKWPNDVLIDGAKIAGLLLELTPDAKWILIGSGVNVRSCPANMPYSVTRLNEWNENLTPSELLAVYVEALEEWRQKLRYEGFQYIRTAWLEKAAGLGKEIAVNLPLGRKTGVFTDLDRDGALLLKEDDGSILRIDAGDIVFLQGGT